MLGFLKENYRWILGGALLTYFSSFGQTYFIAGSVAEWQALFDLSHGEFGRIYMFATLASAVSLPFVGRLVDVMPEHRVIALTAPALATACLAAAFAPNIIVLTIAIYFMRLFGQGMMTHIALTATGRWFAAQRGRAVSLVVMGHQGGEASLPLAFSFIAAGYGFQMGWVAGSVALLLIAAPLGVWAFRVPRIPRGQTASHAETRRSWTRGEVLRDPIFWMLLTGVLAPPFIGTTIVFHQDYLAETRGWPPIMFAQSLSLLAVTTITSSLINGQIIDRVGAVRVLPFFLLPLGAACFVLAFNTEPRFLLVFMVFLGISYGAANTLFGALWPEVYGAEHLGSVRSVIVSFMVFATAAGPGLSGWLIDTGVALSAQISVFGAYCLSVAAIMALASLKLRRRLEREERVGDGAGHMG